MIPSRLRRAVADAYDPALLALCGTIGLLEAGTWVFVAPFLGTGGGAGTVLALLAQRVGLVAVVALLLPGCYAVAVARGDGRGEDSAIDVRDALETAVERVDGEGRRVLVSMLVSRALVVGATVAIALLLIALVGVVDTAVVWIEAYAGVGTDRELLALVGIGTSVVVASTLARGAVGLHDLRAIEEADEPWQAPLWSQRAWRSRPRRFLRYAFLRGTLLTLPLAVAAAVLLAAGAVGGGSLTGPLLTGPSLPALAVATAAFVATTAATRAVLVQYQFSTYEGITKGDAVTVDADGHWLPRRRRVFLAGVVVLAAIAGAGAIRGADVHPELQDDPVDAVPENAEATVEAAIERTAARDAFLEQETDVWNASRETWETETSHQILLDRTDRELVYYGTLVAGANETERTIYSADGRLAMLRVPVPPARPAPYHVTFERGSWSVLVGTPYGWGLEERIDYPPADAGWTLAERSGSRLVYRLDDASGLAADDLGPLLGVPDDDDVELRGVRDVRLVIDRETLTVRRLSGQVAYADPDDGSVVRKRWDREITNVGAVDVSRPSALPPPSLPARLWDAVYY